jgi:D-glycero-alpha-D-manno-heptose 1-phosphate guanylyltransferase
MHSKIKSPSKKKVINTAVILAGGLGSRLKTVLGDRPKPLVDIAGRPFLEHLFKYWKHQGIEHFVLSVGYRHNKIIEYFGNSYEGCSLEYVVESKPLGTGGGLLLCQHQFKFNEPFLLLNGDTFFPVDMVSLQNQIKKYDADWVFSLFQNTDNNRYLALKLDGNGKILIGEKIKKEQSNNIVQWFNGGVYCVHPRALSPFMDIKTELSLSLETDLVPICYQLAQKIYGLKCSAPFIDIGTLDDFNRAQNIIYFKQNNGL